MDGAALREWITTFAGNIFLAVVGLAALGFLFKREFTQFMSYMALAVAVGLLLYNPQVIKAMADTVAHALGGAR